jgi:hypothetical protein
VHKQKKVNIKSWYFHVLILRMLSALVRRNTDRYLCARSVLISIFLPPPLNLCVGGGGGGGFPCFPVGWSNWPDRRSGWEKRREESCRVDR